MARVAPPIATARTKSRRSNLPFRRSLQHGQEASRRTICKLVIVPLLAVVSRKSSFAEACPFTLILHTRSRRKRVTLLRRDHLQNGRLAFCSLTSDHRLPYWLAQTIRAIHNTSRTCSVHSPCAGSIERSSIDFAVRRLSSFTITPPAAVLSTTRSPRRIEAAGDTM